MSSPAHSAVVPVTVRLKVSQLVPSTQADSTAAPVPVAVPTYVTGELAGPIEPEPGLAAHTWCHIATPKIRRTKKKKSPEAPSFLRVFFAIARMLAPP